MSGMEKISEAILSKVRREADDIIRAAEEKAQQEVAKAQKQRESRFEEEKLERMEQAEEEAARILAQASIKARQEVLSAKADIIDEIIARVKGALERVSSDEGAKLGLIQEALKGLGVDKARVYVSPKDLGEVKRLLKADRELGGRIVEIREFDCRGGVIAEDIEGKVRIDNTYETRLELLLPRILPQLEEELFRTP
jgi:V/A-type H+-transporting ATPase subunit E